MPDLEEQLLAAAGTEEETLPEVSPEVETELTPEVEIEPEVTPEIVGEENEVTPEVTPNQLAAYIKANYGEDFSGKYQSDAELLKGLVHAAKKIGERDEDSQLGRYVRDNPKEALAWIQQQLGQQVQQAPAPQASGPPEYDPTWQQDVELDEQGRAVRSLSGDPSVVQKYNRAWDHARKQHQEWLFNPQKVLEPYLAQAEERAVKKAREQWEQDWNSRYGQMTERQDAEQILSKNVPWLFVEGDPQKGYSASGRLYKETVDAWHQRRPDMTSQELNDIAVNAVKARFPSRPAPVKTAPVKPGAARATNVQKQTVNQELQRLDGESLTEMLLRVEGLHPGTIAGKDD